MPILLPKECELNLTKLFILFKPKIFIRKLLLILLQFAPIILCTQESKFIFIFRVLYFGNFKQTFT